MTPNQDKRLADWMTRAQGGDKASYDALLREIAQMLRGFFASRSDCNEAADDLVQETLVSIHRARHTYMTDRPFAPWMFAIARCRLADHWRKHSRRVAQVPLDATLETTHDQAETVPDEHPLAEQVKKSLEQLPPNQRRIVQLLKLDGLSIKEAARLMEMSEAAVKVAAHRAYERLRSQFGSKENGN